MDTERTHVITDLPHEPVDVDAALGAYVRGCAPRPFAVCGVELTPAGALGDAAVLTWGLAFDDHAVALDDTHRVRGRFTTAERVRDVLGRLGPVRLVWLDTTPDGTASGGTGPDGAVPATHIPRPRHP